MTGRICPDDLERLADLVAVRVAEQLRDQPPARTSRLLTAAEVADMLGVSRDSVYGMADELGAVRIGSGPRPRLRFPADAVERWSARDEQNGWQPPSPGPDSAPHRASRRRASRASATAVELLPIRRPTGGAS